MGSSPTSLVLALAIAFSLAAAPASAGTSAAPEVRDDGIGEAGIPPALNVQSGWVANETADSFSIFMELESLASPPNASVEYNYHFHFQVMQTDGSTALYHAMVHHLASGAWVYMVQRWVPVGATGVWGDTNLTTGFSDAASGTIDVRVLKAFVRSPKVDIQKNTWRIDRFYIHADEVDLATGAIVRSDSAPYAGSMGAYDVTAGTPVAGGSPGFGAWAALAAVALGAAVLLRLSRKPR